MNRRALFHRLGIATVALAVAPAVQAEATDDPPLEMQSWTLGYQASERAEWERQQASNAGHAFPRGAPLTFESMRADCAARGCSIDREYNPTYRGVYYVHSGFAGPTYQTSDINNRFEIYAVDAWRRSLHDLT